MEDIYAIIADNIKTCRKSKRLSQEDLAAAAGLSKNYISLVETGQERIGMRAFLCIKQALGVDAGRLFGERD